MESWASAPSDYDPSLEWPGSDADSESEAQNSRSPPPTSSSQCKTCFRLVVKSSAVLARKKRVAVLDAYEEAQIGRDASASQAIPRIRLKDMEVSKLHATLFWDRERKEWAVVDMGSKHGTFVKSGSRCVPSAGRDDAQASRSSSLHLNASTSNPAFARLSPPRQSSMPRTLRHSDELRIGTTVFVIHVHPTGVPCDDCHLEGEVNIPLFSVTSGRQTRNPARVAEEGSKAPPRDARNAISLLKRSLLSRHSDASNSLNGASQLYIDRSAKRRALYPYSRSSSPSPGVPSLSAANFAPSNGNVPLVDTSRAPSASSSGAGFDHDIGPSSVISAPPAPISGANVGHRLLQKQGWVPGSTLGVSTRPPNASDTEELPPADDRMALSEPLQIATNLGRRGLGMLPVSSAHTTGTTIVKKTSPARVANWREESRIRRWDEVRRRVV